VAERSAAFAPGRVNLIGEHTDYNEGLALPFAISQGITVRARRNPATRGDRALIEAWAEDLGEHDEFPAADPPPASGWRAFVHGAVAELSRAGLSVPGAQLSFGGDVPYGAGLSSSAALEVSLCLALIELVGTADPALAAEADPALVATADPAARERPGRIELARLCARIENEWVGARTGLLDQLASLCGAPHSALLIDFQSLEIGAVPLHLDGWRIVVLDSGERHSHASSGYNQRRAEAARACELLGVRSLREADPRAVEDLPEPLRRRAQHVLGENERVMEAASALRADDLARVGELLNVSHASLRDRYEVSTPAVEAAVARLRAAGAAGARQIGGGFGGSVLGLFAPGRAPPRQAVSVRPGPGARVLEPQPAS
jgi:galactokinase